MTNLEKYDEAFMKSLSLEKPALTEKLVYQSVPTWDSVGHMSLIAALEEAFEIMMETDDIIDFNSYEKGKQILSETYNVKFN